ncbi:MAG: glutamine synthetase family protein [Pseudomonadota bacterium]
MDTNASATFRVAACDLNGQMRGKRVPASHMEKLDTGLLRMPISIMNADIFGADIENSPLVFDSGDADGILLPTGRGPVPMPWLDTPTPLVPMVMHREDGSPFEGDPRHALAAVLERYAARDWTVMAATELEFTLVDDSGDTLSPAKDPATGRPLEAAQILSVDQIDRFDAFFDDVYNGAAAMDIPARATTSESGLGQFEVTLTHQDAMRAADDAWLFKTLIRCTARSHGMAATFMAKPFLQDAGNGLHVHFSVLDQDGKNVFDNGGPEGTDTLLSAIAGCIEALVPSTLIFAPHAGSYDRLVRGAHAPTAASWAYENRTSAIRVPGGTPSARRIEHRVAGGDTNPYLMLAVILGAAMVGIEDNLTPPPPISGNAYEQDLPELLKDWHAATGRFATDPLMPRILPAELIRNMALTKEQEIGALAAVPKEEHWKVYLETV